MFQFLLIFFKDIVTPVISPTQIAFDIMCVQNVIQEFFHIFFYKGFLLYFLTWKIKLIYTLLIRCKFMCCSQHFKTYLLSLQYILFFDWRRASYIILLIYMVDWNSLVYASLPSDISRAFSVNYGFYMET